MTPDEVLPITSTVPVDSGNELDPELTPVDKTNEIATEQDIYDMYDLVIGGGQYSDVKHPTEGITVKYLKSPYVRDEWLENGGLTINGTYGTNECVVKADVIFKEKELELRPDRELLFDFFDAGTGTNPGDAPLFGKDLSGFIANITVTPSADPYSNDVDGFFIVPEYGKLNELQHAEIYKTFNADDSITIKVEVRDSYYLSDNYNLITISEGCLGYFSELGNFVEDPEHTNTENQYFDVTISDNNNIYIVHKHETADHTKNCYSEYWYIWQPDSEEGRAPECKVKIEIDWQE